MQNLDKDVTLGFQALMRWALIDNTRRYSVEWSGPVISVSGGWRGGWKVAVWNQRKTSRRLVTFLGGNSLTRAIDLALQRYQES